MKCMILHIPTGKYLVPYTSRYRGGVSEEYVLTEYPYLFNLIDGCNERIIYNHVTKLGCLYESITSFSELLIIEHGE